MTEYVKYPGRKITMTIFHPDIGDDPFEPVVKAAVLEQFARMDDAYSGVERYDFIAANGAHVKVTWAEEVEATTND